MRKSLLSCTVIGLILLPACVPSAVIIPTQTSPPTSTTLPTTTSTLSPTATLSPVPTATNTPLPLTHLDLWLSIEDDPSAPPISRLKAKSVTVLYIWTKAPKGMEGDFTLQVTLQDGTQDQLGPTFHAPPDGQIMDCGHWEGGFLATRGMVKLEAYAGDLLIGRFVFSID